MPILSNPLANLGQLGALGSVIDPVVAPVAHTADGAVNSFVGSAAPVLEPVTSPIVPPVASAANPILDAAPNPVLAPVVANVGNVVAEVAPATGSTLDHYFSPATGSLHLPATGDVFTPILADHGTEHNNVLMGAILGQHQADASANANAHVHANTSADLVSHLGDHLLDPSGVLDHLHI